MLQHKETWQATRAAQKQTAVCSHTLYDTIRHDTMDYINVRPKADE